MLSFELAALPPRHYCDFTVPLRTDGSRLTRCEEPGDYQLYTRWLAEYLYGAPLPLSPEQEEWAARQESPSCLVFALSDLYGGALWDLSILEERFAAGEDIVMSAEDARAFYLDEFSMDGEEVPHYPFAQWLKNTENKLARLRQEWEEQKAGGETWFHADIPYRSLLAFALRQIPDAKTRQQEVDYFFSHFGEEASK